MAHVALYVLYGLISLCFLHQSAARLCLVTEKTGKLVRIQPSELSHLQYIGKQFACEICSVIKP